MLTESIFLEKHETYSKQRIALAFDPLLFLMKFSYHDKKNTENSLTHHFNQLSALTALLLELYLNSTF